MTAQKPAELLACPFCGSPGEIVKNDFPPRNRWRHPSCTSPRCVAHVCEQDEQGGTLVDFNTDAEAIKLWNTRLAAAPCPGREEPDDALLECAVIQIMKGLFPLGSTRDRSLTADRGWDDLQSDLKKQIKIWIASPALGMAGVRGRLTRESNSPDPCSDLSIGELIEWLDAPQYTNGFIDFEAANHMSAAAELLDQMIPENEAALPPASQDSPTRPDGLGGRVNLSGTDLLPPDEVRSIDAALSAKPAPAAVDPVAWRIYCTNNGATGYLYTEALPFEPGPGVVVRREPEPLYAEPAAVGEIREASREEIARIIDPDAFADPNALSPIARFIREARLPERQIAALAKSDAILASLPAGSGEWQPIETAPHEQRVLLGWIYDGSWFCETGMASHGWSRNGISNMSRHGQATHWMPLPSPSPPMAHGESRA